MGTARKCEIFFLPASSPGAAGGELEERVVERRVGLHGDAASAAAAGEVGSDGSRTGPAPRLRWNRPPGKRRRGGERRNAAPAAARSRGGGSGRSVPGSRPHALPNPITCACCAVLCCGGERERERERERAESGVEEERSRERKRVACLVELETGVLLRGKWEEKQKKVKPEKN